MSKLSEDILNTRRRYFIKYVKAPLMKRIIKLCQRYPDATKENCDWPNAHVLIDIEQKYLEYEGCEHIKSTVGPGQNVVIGECEHDVMYRGRFEWWVEQIIEAYLDGRWKPRIKTRPSRSNWKEPLETKP